MNIQYTYNVYSIFPLQSKPIFTSGGVAIKTRGYLHHLEISQCIHLLENE